MTDREGCIALNMVQGIGFARYSALVEAFGSPGKALLRTAAEYRSVPGIGAALAAELSSFDYSGEVEAELEVADRAGVQILTLCDDDYPAVLKELYDPPLCLYIRGRLPEFPDNAVAVVGSRRISSYGERMGRSIASDAAAAGFTVVSGLAYGMDTVAHTAVVDAAGTTVAVLGGGLKHIHPKENIPLARRIIETGGAVISEFPLDFPVSRTSFPRRNRIVAGLCRATIVVEAGTESGALITARLAMENGRDVFAVPGHADNPQAQGCHKLIKEGASLIENFDDVLNAFGAGLLPGIATDGVPGSGAELDANLRVVYDLISGGECTLEEIQQALGIETGDLLSRLMHLELKFLIEKGADRKYRKVR